MSITEQGLSIPTEMLVNTARHAVYRCYSDQGELLYVGTTGHLGRRLAAHAEKIWFLQVRGITLEWYPDEIEAGLAERRAIHVEHPKYNTVHKNARPAPSRPRRRVAVAPDVRAAELLVKEPQMTGTELARRIGVSPSYGRKLRVRFIEEHA